VVLNVSESNVYQEALITSTSFDAIHHGGPAATCDHRAEPPMGAAFQQAVRDDAHEDYSSPTLHVGLGLIYNYVDLWTPQRTTIFNTGARATVVATIPCEFHDHDGGKRAGKSRGPSPRWGDFHGPAAVCLPARGFRLEGKFAYSDSTSWYDPQGRRNSIRDTNTPTASGVSYRAQRADSMAEKLTFTQIARADIPTAPASPVRLSR